MDINNKNKTTKELFEYNIGNTTTEELIKNLSIKCNNPETVTIGPQFYCYRGENITIGDNFHADVGLIIQDYGSVLIGNNVEIGTRVTIATKSREKIESEPVVIKDNVIIEPNTTIMPGVTIGEDAIIKAGSVVTINVLPHTIHKNK